MYNHLYKSVHIYESKFYILYALFFSSVHTLVALCLKSKLVLGTVRVRVRESALVDQVKQYLDTESLSAPDVGPHTGDPVSTEVCPGF